MLRIRPAAGGDVAAIKQLLYETWVDTYTSVVPLAVVDEVTASWHEPAKLEREITGGATCWLVAELPHDPIAGIASGHIDAELIIRLGRLYVRPAHQRSGIGGALMERLLGAFPDAVAVRLEVEEKNPKGRQFYERHGFREVKRIRQDLGHVEAYCIVLEKRL